MGDDPRRLLSDDEQRAAARAVRAGLALSGLDATGLWLASVALDPDALAPRQLARLLRDDGAVSITAHQHDVLAQALNDHFVERGDGHLVRYSAELRCT